MRQFLRCLALLLAAWSASSPLHAEDRLLTVRGAIASNEKDNGNTVFTEAGLLALRQYTIKTSTAWTPVSEFSGPRLSDILDKAGAKGSHVEIHCFDDYSYTIPIAELKRYEPILAHSRNGKRLRVNDFGPLFLVYPRDQYPDELRTPTAEAKFIWQIRELVVK